MLALIASNLLTVNLAGSVIPFGFAATLRRGDAYILPMSTRMDVGMTLVIPAI